MPVSIPASARCAQCGKSILHRVLQRHLGYLKRGDHYYCDQSCERSWAREHDTWSRAGHQALFCSASVRAAA
jgi:hypothetical protein